MNCARCLDTGRYFAGEPCGWSWCPCVPIEKMIGDPNEIEEAFALDEEDRDEEEAP